MKKRADTATVQGRKFRLHYDGKFVFFGPLNGDSYTPCGWLEIDRFIRGV